MEHHIYFLGDALDWRLSTVDKSSLVTALFSLSSLSSLLGDKSCCFSVWIVSQSENNVLACRIKISS